MERRDFLKAAGTGISGASAILMAPVLIAEKSKLRPDHGLVHNNRVPDEIVMQTTYYKDCVKAHERSDKKYRCFLDDVYIVTKKAYKSAGHDFVAFDLPAWEYHYGMSKMSEYYSLVLSLKDLDCEQCWLY
jgi:hypothetical protein